MPISGKRSRVIFLAMLIAGCALFYAQLRDDHNWGADFAAYISQARSIVDGDMSAYVEANRFNVEHSSRVTSPVTYPWGFPLMLAPVVAAFGLDIKALKLIGLVSYGLLLVILYLGFGKSHSPGWRLLLVALFAFNPAILAFGNHVLSDLPYLALSTLSAVLIGITVVERRVLISPLADAALMGASLAAAYLTRSIGIGLVATLALAHTLSSARNPRSVKESDAPENPASNVFTVAVPYLLFGALVLLDRVVFPRGPGIYLEYLGNTSPGMVLGNVFYYSRLPAAFFSGLAIYVATLPFVALGIRARWLTDYHLILYSLMVVGICLVWPARQGLRFLFPVLPFYVSFMITGFQIAARFLQARVPAVREQFVAGLPGVLLLLPLMLGAIQQADRNLNGPERRVDGPYIPEAREMLTYIEKNTSTSDVIVFRKPRVIMLMAGRPSVMIDRVEQLAIGEYLVIDLQLWRNQIKFAELGTLLKEGRAETVFQNKRFVVLRLSRPS